MKIKKLGLRLMLVSIIIFSNVSSSQVFADTIDYSASIEKMQQLEVLDKPSGDVNGTVTRGQFVKAIAIATGLTSTSSNLKGTTTFPDITANSELSEYVDDVVGLGLMYAMPDGLFHPEHEITNATADTIMVRLLGYTDTDPQLSLLAWPNNYIHQASNLKLTTGMVMKSNDKLTYKVEAVLFDRLFDTLIKGSTTQYFSDDYFASKYPDIDIKGKLVEATIIGNSKTSDDLADNQIYMVGIGLADKIKYTVNSDAGEFELGVKYKIYLNGNTITKVCVKENDVENYAVTSVAGFTIAYEDDKNLSQTMTLPEASLYYYHGVAVDYEVAAKAVRAYSSIVLAKKSDNSGYDYGVIIDPNFGEPKVYKADNTKLINQLKTTKYAFIYRNANIQESQLNAYDVVYFVSDIWDKNTFIYVNDKVVIGTITAFIPDMLNPTGLTINKVNYNFSKYFNKSRLNNYDGSIDNFLTNVNVNDFKTLVLGVDGSIVDIY